MPVTITEVELTLFKLFSINLYFSYVFYLAAELEFFKELLPELAEVITLDLIWSASLLVMPPIIYD